MASTPDRRAVSSTVKAVALMVFASAIFAAVNLLAKTLGTDALGPPLHPLQLAHARFVFALITVVTLIAIMRPVFTRPAVPLHFARAFCAFAGVTLMFAAAAMIPLSDATAISFLGPLFTMVLAALFLGEHVSRVRWFAAFVGICGAVVLLRPGAGAFEFGALLALMSAVAMGVELTLIKRLAMREGVLQILVFANAFGVVFSSLATIPVWTMPALAQWPALAALGVLMLVVQICYVRALAMADASFVAPIAYTALLFAALYDLAIFSVVPDMVSIAGAALILAGALLLATRDGRPASSPVKGEPGPAPGPQPLEPDR